MREKKSFSRSTGHWGERERERERDRRNLRSFSFPFFVSGRKGVLMARGRPVGWGGRNGGGRKEWKETR